jgi:hypothetical protein
VPFALGGIPEVAPAHRDGLHEIQHHRVGLVLPQETPPPLQELLRRSVNDVAIDPLQHLELATLARPIRLLLLFTIKMLPSLTRGTYCVLFALMNDPMEEDG